MHMEHCLTSTAPVVHHQAVSPLLKALLVGEHLGNKKEMTDIFSVSVLHTLDISQMGFGNDKDMDRRLWIDVLKGKCLCVLIKYLGRNLLLDDSTEKTVLVKAHVFPLSPESS